jgi:hypothetical protein
MKTYTVHVPPGSEPGDPEAIEEARLVKDGFSFSAFFFTALYFAVKGFWLVALLVLVALAALLGILAALKVGPGAAFAAEVLFSLLVGLEAGSLQRWALERRRWVMADVVSATRRDEAEEKALARWLAASSDRMLRFTASGLTPPYRAGEAVIGLFPEPERRR